MQQPSPSGSRYYVTFKDDFSGYRAIYFLKLKSDVFDSFKLFVCKLKSETNHNIRTLRSDGGGEFLSTEFVNWLTEKCIRHETTVAHTPQQNGVIERDHRTTGEAERSAMLNMKNIPQELWAESYNCAVYTLNRTLSSTISATPYELWFGRKPKLDHLRIFGCEAYTHIPACDRRKLDPKSIKCIFVGYCDNTKAYRLWDAVSRRIKISRDVLFNENTQSTHPDSTISPERDETPPTVVPPRRSEREPQPKRLWAELATEESSTNSSTEETKEPTNFSISHLRSRLSEMESRHGRRISILDGE
jgi:hypothetical protein